MIATMNAAITRMTAKTFIRTTSIIEQMITTRIVIPNDANEVLIFVDMFFIRFLLSRLLPLFWIY